MQLDLHIPKNNNVFQGEEKNEELIVRSVKNGDKKAFDLLVLKYQFKIFKLITKYTKDPTESLDLVQEVFIKAYTGINNFQQKCSFYTWLYTIAINTARSYLVSNNKSIKYTFNELENQILLYSKNLTQYQQKGINYNINNVHNEELKELFFRLVNTLPKQLNQTITLKEIYGKTYKEIAIIMKCPIGTVRSRISRAKQALKNNLLYN